MQQLSRFGLVAALVLIAVTNRADGYHLFYLNSAGTQVPVKWQTFGNVFIADSDGPTGQNFTTLCTTAVGTWNAVVDAKDLFGTPTTSAVNFTGANLHTAWGNLTGDGKYELVYDADGSALTLLGYDPASVNGYGPTRQRLVGGQGVIDDAFFVVTGTRTNFDLLSTLIHELGHIQGLAHSTVGMHTSLTPSTALDKIDINSVPTMHPFSLGTGNTSRRTLEADDMAALRELYPETGAAARWASIAGEVRRCGSNNAVVGANVRLVSTANANVQISRFSAYDGNSNGRYVMNYIPAGSYRVVVEPLGANGFTLGRFGPPPSATENDFDFEYLSPPAVELACTEEMPESGSANIATLTGSNGVTLSNNDFRVGGPDLAFVVDDTGSMTEEIGGVRSILNATITALQAASIVHPFPLTAIVTFKDDVTKRIVSNNPANLRAVVNSLVAAGGDDCPEASNAALLVAGGMLRKNAVAMLFTDADSRPDGPASSTVTALYRSKGVRLFTLLSGTCTGSISSSINFDPPVNGTAPTQNGSPNQDEYPAEPVNGFLPGVTTFSTISSNTGGFFVAIPGINSANATETTRYVNTGTNLSVSTVLPAIALVTPTNTPRSTTLNVELNGSNTNFIVGKSTVSFVGGGIAINSVSVTSATRLTMNVTVAGSADLGFRDASVITDLGGGVMEEAKGIGVINITTAPSTPTILSVTPGLGGQGQTIDATISAAGVVFTSGSVASFGTGVTVLSTQFVNATTLVAHIQIGAGAAIGYRFISVTTPGASPAVDGSPTGAFQVVTSAPIVPIIQSVTPNQVSRGATMNITVTGLNTNFGAGTALSFSGVGITVNSITVNSATVLVANITVDLSAPLGFRDITATTAGQPAAILSGLQVLSTGPSLIIAKTHTGNFIQGQTNAQYSISVTNSGAGSTNGSAVTVTDTVPAGLTLVSMSGTGWTCVAAACTRSDALAVGASYPAIAAIVNVAAGASSPQVNQAGVSGGGSASASSSDSTVVGVNQPKLNLSVSSLNFGFNGALITGPQPVTVSFTGGLGVNWTASSNQSNITVNPSSGAGNAVFQVMASPGSSGTITVTAPGAISSPQQIQVKVSGTGSDVPFGNVDTPVNNSAGIAGAIAVTGWALDPVDISKVDVWREPVAGEPASSNGLVFIGDAVFVADARPDVEASYPNAPRKNRAGWGYQLLTSLLPNNGGSAGLGNGTYRLHAIAHNTAGAAVDLGTRTFTADNAHAAKPFGTIDTPVPGSTISGNAFVNFGWALTQNPLFIPTDGSTITVMVDGQILGHPVYNQFRSDIASLFPGRANSGGAVGYFMIDTTKLSNGVHTIQWVVFDSGGHGDGIGSRFFNVLNSGVLGGVTAPEENVARTIPVPASASAVLDADIDEMGRIELPTGATSGHLRVNGDRRPLPAGSSLSDGVFYWHPGPGFRGHYELVFNRPDGTDLVVRVHIGRR